VIKGQRFVAILATASIVIAACSSGATQQPTGQESSAPSQAGDPTVAAAQAVVDVAMQARTAADSQLPTTGPKAVAGKKLISIVCAAAIEGCRAIADAQVEAAQAIGWEASVIDGKGSPQGWNDAMQAAIAAKPDAIALAAILPEAIEGSLQQAKEAGIKVLCTQCGGSGSAQELVDVSTGDEVNAIVGTDLGNYILAKSNGNANVLMWFYPEFGISKIRHDNAKDVLSKCSGCATETIEVKISEWGTTLLGRVQSLLQQKPDVNWIYSPADETAIDAMNAIEAGGLKGKVQVVGGNGNLQALQTIATSDTYVATAAVSYAFGSWAGIDGLNRIFAGEAPIDTKSPVRLIDKTNESQIESGKYYTGDVDFRAAYRAIWGK